MKNILVVGSRGFIGSELCKELSNHGYNVTGTRRNNQEPSTETKEIEIHQQTGFEGRSDEFDLIFYLASSYFPDNNEDRNNLMIRDNIPITNQLVKFISRKKISVIATGSYFQKYKGGEVPWSEYSIYKNTARDLLKLMSQQQGNSLRYIYLYDTYGLNLKRQKFIDQIITSIVNDQVIHATPGEQVMNISSISDVVKGLVQSMKTLTSGAVSEEFQIKSEETLTLIEIVDQIEIGMNKKLNINWGAKPYRKREVFELWDCAPDIPNHVFQNKLNSYVSKHRNDYEI